jgi:hypothetical protein
MRVLWFFPVLVYAAIAYALVAFTSAGGDVPAHLAQHLFSIKLASGAEWGLTVGQVLLVFATLCFFFELIKASEPTQAAIAEIGVATAASVIFVLLFVLHPKFGTTEFFLITVMSLLDMFAGFLFLVSESRRTVEIERE